RCARRAATGLSAPRYASTCATSAATSGTARSDGRPLATNNLATAARSNGSTASPYSVSVGSATMPPPRIHVAASSIASRCGAPRSTITRRIVPTPGAASSSPLAHLPRDDGRKNPHDGQVDEEHGADARPGKEAGQERTAGHADERRARQDAERRAVGAGGNHSAGSAVRRRHGGA